MLAIHNIDPQSLKSLTGLQRIERDKQAMNGAAALAFWLMKSDRPDLLNPVLDAVAATGNSLT